MVSLHLDHIQDPTLRPLDALYSSTTLCRAFSNTWKAQGSRSVGLEIMMMPSARVPLICQTPNPGIPRKGKRGSNSCLWTDSLTIAYCNRPQQKNNHVLQPEARWRDQQRDYPERRERKQRCPDNWLAKIAVKFFPNAILSSFWPTAGAGAT